MGILERYWNIVYHAIAQKHSVILAIVFQNVTENAVNVNYFKLFCTGEVELIICTAVWTYG